VADLDGELCSLSSENLARHWCVKTPGKKSYASIVPDGHGRLLYPTSSDGLWVLDPKDGSVVTKWIPTESEGKWAKVFGRVSVGPDGWFLADVDGNVRKLEASDESHETGDSGLSNAGREVRSFNALPLRDRSHGHAFKVKEPK
jgi:hypothetical protein